MIWANGIITILLGILASVTVIGILIVPAIIGGYIESLIRVRRGEDVKIGHFFKTGFDQWWSLFLLSLLLFLGIFTGYLVLIIPGIYLSVAWMFVFYVKLDIDISITEAFRVSMDLVSDTGWWWLFLYSLIIGISQQILSIIPIINFLLIFLFPYFSMMYIEAYILITDKKSSLENLIHEG